MWSQTCHVPPGSVRRSLVFSTFSGGCCWGVSCYRDRSRRVYLLGWCPWGDQAGGWPRLSQPQHHCGQAESSTNQGRRHCMRRFVSTALLLSSPELRLKKKAFNVGISLGMRGELSIPSTGADTSSFWEPLGMREVVSSREDEDPGLSCKKRGFSSVELRKQLSPQIPVHLRFSACFIWITVECKLIWGIYWSLLHVRAQTCKDVSAFDFHFSLGTSWASQVALGVKNLPANAEDRRDPSLIPGQ